MFNKQKGMGKLPIHEVKSILPYLEGNGETMVISKKPIKVGDRITFAELNKNTGKMVWLNVSIDSSTKGKKLREWNIIYTKELARVEHIHSGTKRTFLYLDVTKEEYDKLTSFEENTLRINKDLVSEPGWYIILEAKDGTDLHQTKFNVVERINKDETSDELTINGKLKPNVGEQLILNTDILGPVVEIVTK